MSSSIKLPLARRAASSSSARARRVACVVLTLRGSRATVVDERRREQAASLVQLPVSLAAAAASRQDCGQLAGREPARLRGRGPLSRRPMRGRPRPRAAEATLLGRRAASGPTRPPPRAPRCRVCGCADPSGRPEFDGLPAARVAVSCGLARVDHPRQIRVAVPPEWHAHQGALLIGVAPVHARRAPPARRTSRRYEVRSGVAESAQARGVLHAGRR